MYSRGVQKSQFTKWSPFEGPGNFLGFHCRPFVPCHLPTSNSRSGCTYFIDLICIQGADLATELNLKLEIFCDKMLCFNILEYFNCLLLYFQVELSQFTWEPSRIQQNFSICRSALIHCYATFTPWATLMGCNHSLGRSYSLIGCNVHKGVQCHRPGLHWDDPLLHFSVLGEKVAHRYEPSSSISGRQKWAHENLLAKSCKFLNKTGAFFPRKKFATGSPTNFWMDPPNLQTNSWIGLSGLPFEGWAHLCK